jgi:UDP-glucose 4-epimerase
MRVLITGHSGFIGQAAVRALTHADIEEIDGFSLDEHDVRDFMDIAKATKRVDTIVHLAAAAEVPFSLEYPTRTFESNVVGLHNVLMAAHGNSVKRVIFASSSVAERPRSPYAASKAAGEAYCKAFAESYGIDVCILRFTNVYGPGSWHKTTVVAEIMRRILQRDTITIYGDGSARRDFVHIDDVAQAVALTVLSERCLAGRTISIGSGTHTSLNSVLAKITLLHGAEPLHVHKPVRPGETLAPPPSQHIADAHSLLGYVPKFQHIDLASTYEYFKAEADRLAQRDAGIVVTSRERKDQS